MRLRFTPPPRPSSTKLYTYIFIAHKDDVNCQNKAIYFSEGVRVAIWGVMASAAERSACVYSIVGDFRMRAIFLLCISVRKATRSFTFVLLLFFYMTRGGCLCGCLLVETGNTSCDPDKVLQFSRTNFYDNILKTYCLIRYLENQLNLFGLLVFISIESFVVVIMCVCVCLPYLRHVIIF